MSRFVWYDDINGNTEKVLMLHDTDGGTTEQIDSLEEDFGYPYRIHSLSGHTLAESYDYPLARLYDDDGVMLWDSNSIAANTYVVGAHSDEDGNIHVLYSVEDTRYFGTLVLEGGVTDSCQLPPEFPSASMVSYDGTIAILLFRSGDDSSIVMRGYDITGATAEQLWSVTLFEYGGSPIDADDVEITDATMHLKSGENTLALVWSYEQSVPGPDNFYNEVRRFDFPDGFGAAPTQAWSELIIATSLGHNEDEFRYWTANSLGIFLTHDVILDGDENPHNVTALDWDGEVMWRQNLGSSFFAHLIHGAAATEEHVVVALEGTSPL